MGRRYAFVALVVVITMGGSPSGQTGSFVRNFGAGLFVVSQGIDVYLG